MLTVGILLISLTGIWTFIILTVGVLLKSLTGIWSFTILAVGVLLKLLIDIVFGPLLCLLLEFYSSK